MATVNDYPEQFNIIPIKRNSKIPNFKWEVYQEKKYPREKLYAANDNGNFAVICGEISHNLLVLDLDLKSKKYFPKVYKKFCDQFPELSKTKIVMTPHGYHLYYYMREFSVDRQTNKNARYKKNNKFSGRTKTKFKEWFKGVDILGNNGYAMIWGSRVDSLPYKIAKDNPILYITKEGYEQIIDFFLLEKPLRIRRPFLDILNGKLEIEGYATQTGKEEFIYWKYLFREAYHFAGLEPQEIYDGLAKNQPSFDLEKTEVQLQHHPYTDKPLTNEKLKEYFPEYNIKTEKPKEKRKKKSKPKPQKKKVKILTPERIEECKEWLRLSAREKYDYIDELIRFRIVGEDSQKQAKMLFFLKLGDVLSRKLISKVDFHGDPSSGKSYITDYIVSFFPEECYISLFNASPKALLYDSSFDRDTKFIYLRELTKSNKEMVELLKALYDGDVNYIVTNYEKLDVEKFKKTRTGLITTYSFEYTQRDAIDRAWVFTPDQSLGQTKKVIDFKLKKRTHQIEYDFKELAVQKRIEFLKDVIRVLKDMPEVYVQIPYLEMIKPIFKETHLRVRRDTDKLPDLIEVLARFNYLNRKSITFNKRTYIFSNYEDLDYSLRIGLKYFLDVSQNVDEVQKQILNFMVYTEIVVTKGKIGQEEVEKWYKVSEIYEEIAHDTTIHSNTVRNKLKGLGANNYIEIKQQGKGKPILYRKLKDYEEPTFPLEDKRDSIHLKVELAYEFWKDKTPDLITTDNFGENEK